MAGERNPAWHADELILALDLYFACDRKLPSSARDSRVVALSDLLNSLPIFGSAERHERFRNANGVYMKLANYQSIDPRNSGGLSGGGKLDRQIWDAYAGNPAVLQELASAIRRNATTEPLEAELLDPLIDEAIEGKVLLRSHLVRERNRAIVASKKRQAVKTHGILRCEVCDFEFAKVYGDLGTNFIECHHTVPVAQLEPGQTTKLVDLALVCANCHRMIHLARPIATIADMRAIVGRNR